MSTEKSLKILIFVLFGIALNAVLVFCADQQEEVLRTEIMKLKGINLQNLSKLERSKKLKEINEVASLIEKSGRIGAQVLKNEMKQEIESGKRNRKIDSYFLIGSASLLSSMTFDETPFVIEALLCSEPQSHLQPYFNLAHGLAQTKDPRILPVLEKLFKLKDVYVSAHNEALGSVFILIYVYGVYGEDGKQSVLKFLNDRDPNCRFNAVALVASLYLDEKSEERLMSIALKDPEPMVRAQAIEYLPDVTGEYFGRREKKVKNLLEDMANSPNPLIAEKAAAAMKLYKGTEQIFLTDLKKGKKIPRNEFSARVKKLISNMGVGIGAEQEDLIATAEIKDLPFLYELREKILNRVSDEGLMDYFNVHGVIQQLKLRSYAKY